MEESREGPFIAPVIIIPLGIFAVSTASIMIRIIQAEEVPSLVIAAWRLFLASLLIAPVALTRYRTELKQLSRQDRVLAIFSGTLLAIHFATWISSLEFTSVASSVLFVSTSPLWVAIFAPLLIREAISRVIIIGLVFALFGGAIVGLSDSCSVVDMEVHCPKFQEFVSRNAFLGDSLALMGAFAGAGYLLIGRRLRGNISNLPYVFVVYGISAIILILLMLIFGQNPFGYDLEVYFWLFLLALIPQLLGHSTINWALRYLSATFVSITLLGEPIGSAILAYIFLDEIPPGLMIFGAILILVGVYIASKPVGKN